MALLGQLKFEWDENKNKINKNKHKISFEQLKDWLEIVLVKGFSLVGPMFAAKFPYPLPAVSLAVYWLIQLV